MQKSVATGVIAGAFIVGTAAASMVLPSIVAAADPTASPAASTSAATTPAATTPATTPSGPGADTGVAGGPGDRGGHGGPGGLDSDDLTAAAKALGMTETDLTTALQGGQTVAAVATARGVDLQKVVDAIAASDKAELAAAVTAGTMTQAQADERLANLTAHVTDEVNGVAGGPGDRGGHGPGDPASGSTTGSGTTSGSGASS